MWDNFFTINRRDHVLEFNGLELISAQYEPDHNCFIDVVFDSDYFISGDTDERIEITSRYRGLKGTQSYQVDLLVGNKPVNTFMVQLTPNGDILTPMKRGQ